MKKILFLLMIGLAAISSCKHEIITPAGIDPAPDSTGTGVNGSICFETDVLPIFQSNCAKSGCHDVTTHEEDYVLDSYDHIMRKGIEKFKASKSKIYEVLFKDGDDAMPKDAPPLTQLQKDRIAQWINEGAVNSTNCNVGCNDSKFNFAADVQPILNTSCTGCHNNSLANGGINLSNYSGVQSAIGKIPASIQHTTTDPNKYMPQAPAAKLNDCQINTIINWINAGALNN